MDPADHLALHELPGRHGDLIDDRDWPGLDRIFPPGRDVVVRTDAGWRVASRVFTSTPYEDPDDSIG